MMDMPRRSTLRQRCSVTVASLLALVLLTWRLGSPPPAQARAPRAARRQASGSGVVRYPGLRFLRTNRHGYREYVDTRDGSVLVLVPGGTFTMGASRSYPDQKPPTRVAVKSFFLGKFIVTNAQFARFVHSTGYNAGAGWKTDEGVWGARAPVACVSWHDSEAYAKWAGLRLPTEAEWEYAARGPKDLRYPWGNTWNDRLCCNSVGTVEPGGPHPVGSYPGGASPFGCLDMAGNMRQWCSTLYRPYPYRADDGRENLSAPGLRVLRGECWNTFCQDFFHCAHRQNDDPSDRLDFYSFRVARSI